MFSTIFEIQLACIVNGPLCNVDNEVMLDMLRAHV